ncbi:MAG: aminopeptidase P family protein [Polyangiaceae bacterium]|nr:aminopeptidase P family protein [Polyangiaceae bacterium]
MQNPRTPQSTFVARRDALCKKLTTPAIIAAGAPLSRNYRATMYPFRATSHFLYLIGANVPSAVLLLHEGRSVLFVVPVEENSELWDGPVPSYAQIKEMYQVDDVKPLNELRTFIDPFRSEVATLPTQDSQTCSGLTGLLGREQEIAPCSGNRLADDTPDAALADALIDLRLRADEHGLEQLRWAGRVTAQAQVAGMRATRRAKSECEVYGAMMGVLRAAAHQDSFEPIVSTHGEVLHNTRHDNLLKDGDLLVADIGGETPEGWAGDITRVWPVSGTFSPTQRAVYEVVLATQIRAIGSVRKGTRYRDVHEVAKRGVVEGMRDLGVFRGDVDGLIERGAAAIFFPHGVGHLLGLDVHDMEDLGDRAGYAPGRTRSQAFGDCFLRLDRDLEPGMAVTIEPGIYQVPAILSDPEYTSAVGDGLCRNVLAKFSDVRGIRIEDDVIVTDGDPEVTTFGVPKTLAEVEALVRSGE